MEKATKENTTDCSLNVKVQNMSGVPSCLEVPGSTEVPQTGRTPPDWEISSSSGKAQAQQGSWPESGSLEPTSKQ